MNISDLTVNQIKLFSIVFADILAPVLVSKLKSTVHINEKYLLAKLQFKIPLSIYLL